MGVFDYLRCKYRLPEGAPTDEYQTKDTPSQYGEHYEIREDGTLWLEDVTREWVDDPECAIFKGYLRRVSSEWKQQTNFTGEIRFYHYNTNTRESWEFSSYFVNGQLRHLETLERPAGSTSAPDDQCGLSNSGGIGGRDG